MGEIASTAKEVPWGKVVLFFVRIEQKTRVA
jgi:hypothetical protein